MHDTNSIYVILGLLYNLGGTALIGIALFFKSLEDLKQLSSRVQNGSRDLLVDKIRQNLDGTIGIIMMFFGFALQAVGHAGQSSDSNINFLLVSQLFLLIIVHFFYIRDVFAENYAKSRLVEVVETEKNKAYFG